MRSFEPLKKTLPWLMLLGVGVLATNTACGSAMRERVMPDLDCGAKPDNSATIAFPNTQPGEIIRAGHARIQGGELLNDIDLTVTAEGQVIASNSHPGDRKPQTQSLEGNQGVMVTTGDEVYRATAQAGTNGWTVTVTGQCQAA